MSRNVNKVRMPSSILTESSGSRNVLCRVDGYIGYGTNQHQLVPTPAKPASISHSSGVGGLEWVKAFFESCHARAGRMRLPHRDTCTCGKLKA
jgi:hypothetical protein